MRLRTATGEVVVFTKHAEERWAYRCPGICAAASVARMRRVKQRILVHLGVSKVSVAFGDRETGAVVVARELGEKYTVLTVLRIGDTRALDERVRPKNGNRKRATKVMRRSMEGKR